MKLLLLFCLLCAFQSHAYNSKSDHLNETFVKHAYRHDDANIEVTYPERKPRILYVVLLENDWKGEAAINERMREIGHQMIESKEERDQFSIYFQKNIDLLLEWEYMDYDDSESKQWIADGRDEYTASELEVDMDIVGLNDHILIVSCKIECHAKRSKYDKGYALSPYRKYYYFDLNTGEEIDPKTIIARQKREAFYQHAYELVADSLKNTISYDDVLNANPIFRGASFYLLVKGSPVAEYTNDFNYHIRMPLDEIQPFLNKKGPFKRYLTHKESRPDPGYPLDEERESGAWWTNGYYHIIETELLLEQPVNGGFRSAKAYRSQKDRDPYLKFDATYDRKGKVKMTRQFKRNGETEDSTLFTYHENGGIKMIQYFDVEYMPDDDPSDIEWSEDRYYYDELGNMIMYEGIYDAWNDFDYNYMEVDRAYVSYFKDKIVLDYEYECPYGMGMSSGQDLYRIVEGYALSVGSLEGRDDYYSTLTKKGNTLLYSFKRGNTSYKREITLKNNQVVAGKDSLGLWSMTVDYNSDGKATKREVVRKTDTGDIRRSRDEMAYDKHGNQKLFTEQDYLGEVEKSKRTILIEYKR